MYTGSVITACGEVVKVLEFVDLPELEEVNQLVLDQTNGLRSIYWEEDKVGMCECCDCLYDRKDEVLGGRTGQSGFCSDDCKLEADDEIRMWDARDQRNVEIYGDDVASWD